MMAHDFKDRTNEGNDDITLRDILIKSRDFSKHLFSKWLFVGSFAIFGALIGFIYAYNKPPVYVATTTFVLEGGEGSGNLSQYSGLASMVGVNLGGGGGGIFQGDNILELYKSGAMIKRTLLTEVEYQGKTELLVDQYVRFNKLRKSWSENPALAGFKFKPISSKLNGRSLRLQDSVLATIITKINKEYLDVSKPDKSLSIIKVEVKATNEFFAKNFNDLIVRNVNDFYVQTKTKRSLENVKILQQKTDSVRAVMNGAIYAAAIVSDVTPNLNPTRQVQRAAPLQRSQFSAETNKAILGELMKNLELSKITLRKEAPLIQVVDQPYFPLPVNVLGTTKGMLIGAFLFGFLVTAFLSFKYIIRGLLV